MLLLAVEEPSPFCFIFIQSLSMYPYVVACNLLLSKHACTAYRGYVLSVVNFQFHVLFFFFHLFFFFGCVCTCTLKVIHSTTKFHIV